MEVLKEKVAKEKLKKLKAALPSTTYGMQASESQQHIVPTAEKNWIQNASGVFVLRHPA